MEPDEVIVAVFLPNPTGGGSTSPASGASPSPQSFEFVRPFKQVGVGRACCEVKGVVKCVWGGVSKKQVVQPKRNTTHQV